MITGKRTSLYRIKYQNFYSLAHPLAILLALVFCINMQVNASMAATGQAASSLCLNGSVTIDGAKNNGTGPLQVSGFEHCQICNLWQDGKLVGLPPQDNFIKLSMNTAFHLPVANIVTSKSPQLPASIRAPPSPKHR